MPSHDPVARRMQARQAALTQWAGGRDRAEGTRPAREGFLRRFERQVDPDGVLEPEERQRRAEAARDAHMMKLAQRSRAARAARRAQQRRRQEPDQEPGQEPA